MRVLKAIVYKHILDLNMHDAVIIRGCFFLTFLSSSSLDFAQASLITEFDKIRNHFKLILQKIYNGG